MNVALSRVTHIKNLHLIEAYNCNVFQVNSNVMSEYNRFQDSSYFIPCSTLNVNSSCLAVSLLNKRSLRRHLKDIVKDKNLMENDPLSATEIQVGHVKQQLDTYEVYLNVKAISIKILYFVFQGA